MKGHKICLVTGDLPATNGTNLQSFLLARRLTEAGDQVFFVNYRYGNKKDMPCAFQKAESPPEGMPVYELPERPYRPVADFLWYCKTFFSLRRRYDIVVILGTLPGFGWLVPWLKILGKKIVIRMSGLGINDPRTVLASPYGTWKLLSLKMVDSFVGNSTALCKNYSESSLPDDKLSWIPNGVDTERFQTVSEAAKKELRRKLGLAEDDFVVLYVGSFRREKGADLLLDAWDQVLEKVPNALLLIVGPICPVCKSYKLADGGFIKSIKRKLGFFLDGNRIMVLGNHRNRIRVEGVKPEIERYYQAADLFVFPSRREGMPNALMEAMSCALPCIVLDIKEVTGDLIVNGRNGFTIKRNDPPALAEAVTIIFQNRTVREEMGRESRKKIVEGFTAEQLTERYRALFKDLLRPNGYSGGSVFRRRWSAEA